MSVYKNFCQLFSSFFFSFWEFCKFTKLSNSILNEWNDELNPLFQLFSFEFVTKVMTLLDEVFWLVARSIVRSILREIYWGNSCKRAKKLLYDCGNWIFVSTKLPFLWILRNLNEFLVIFIFFGWRKFLLKIFRTVYENEQGKYLTNLFLEYWSF